MPLEIDCTVLGHREAVAQFDAFSRGVINALVKVLSANGDLLTQEFRLGQRNFTGELRRATTKRTYNDGLTICVKSARSWWAYSEWGMGPLGAQTGRDPPGWLQNNRVKGGTNIPFPAWRPGTRLSKWALGHGLDPYLVAKGIYLRQGVAAKPNIGDVLEANKDRILAEIQGAVQGAIPAWIDQETNWRGNREGVTVVVGGAKFDTTESGWVG